MTIIGRVAAVLTALACRRGVHVYLATSCLHGEHQYCQGEEGQAGPKVPACCKFCGAKCVCRCHRKGAQ